MCPVNSDELARWFAHHPPSDAVIRYAHEQVRVHGHRFASWLNELLPDSREKSQALTAVDNAVMHANACIARSQVVHRSALPDLDEDTHGE
jgi:hypothetical protein